MCLISRCLTSSGITRCLRTAHGSWSELAPVQVDADFDVDADDDGLYRRWCWYCLCGHRGCQCWSLSQKLEWSSDYHLQAILTHFLSPKFVLRTVVSKIYNALLISGSSWSFSKLSQRTSQWYTPPTRCVQLCSGKHTWRDGVPGIPPGGLNIFEYLLFENLQFEYLWTSLVVYFFYRHIAPDQHGHHGQHRLPPLDHGPGQPGQPPNHLQQDPPPHLDSHREHGCEVTNGERGKSRQSVKWWEKCILLCMKLWKLSADNAVSAKFFNPHEWKPLSCVAKAHFHNHPRHSFIIDGLYPKVELKE